MSVCSYVRIDAETHTRAGIEYGGKLVDDGEFLDTFHIEHPDSSLQRQLNLPVGLTYTCKSDAIGCKARIEGCTNLTAAHTVGAKTGLCDLFECGEIPVTSFKSMLYARFGRSIAEKFLILFGEGGKIEFGFQTVDPVLLSFLVPSLSQNLSSL